MCTFCFSPYAADLFCFFAFAAGFLFRLAFCGGDHSRRSRTVPVYFHELIRVVTTAPTVISSTSARMCFTYTHGSVLLCKIYPSTQSRLCSFSEACSMPPTDCHLKRFRTSNTVLFSTYSCMPCTCTCKCVRARRAIFSITTVEPMQQRSQNGGSTSATLEL